MQSFSVSQDSFSGPLGLLLELLDKRELEIKDVNLAKIADDYLVYMDQQDVSSEELADFLVVASRLIYLKTKELMPYLRVEEEEEAVASLEDQLRLYRMFKQASEKIEEAYAGSGKIFMRPFVKPKKKEPKFVVPKNATNDTLREAFGWVLKRLEPFFALQEASIERIKSVEERIEEMKGAITSRSKIRFREVVNGAKSKAEVVVSFLALLELVRRNLVKATQTDSKDIEIQKVSP